MINCLMLPRVTARVIFLVPWNLSEGLTIFAKPRHENVPLRDKTKQPLNHWFSLNPVWQRESASAFAFLTELESPSPRDLSMAVWVRKWCGLSGEAVKTTLIAVTAPGRKAMRWMKDMPLSPPPPPPQNGKTTYWSVTSANSRQVLIKDLHDSTQVITVWCRH